MQLKEAINLFLSTYEKDTTRLIYTKALAHVSDQIALGRDINEIQPADLIRVHNTIRAKKYAPATLQQRVKSVKTFFNWLHRMDLIESNPARVISAKKPKRRQSRDKAMTDDELELILDYVRYRNRRDYALILFLADTGCRVGGAAGLKSDDIDWVKREATVTEKGDMTRVVRFGEYTATVLKRYLLWRGLSAGPFVFSSDGNPIKPQTLSQRVRRACYGLRKQGVKIRTLSAHSIRHRKGHQFGDNGINPQIAATAMGHASVMITIENYYPGDWETAAQALDDFAMKPPKLKKEATD